MRVVTVSLSFLPRVGRFPSVDGTADSLNRVSSMSRPVPAKLKTASASARLHQAAHVVLKDAVFTMAWSQCALRGGLTLALWLFVVYF